MTKRMKAKKKAQNQEEMKTTKGWRKKTHKRMRRRLNKLYLACKRKRRH